MKSLDLHAFEGLCDDPDSSGEQVVQFIRSSLDLGHVAFMILKHPKTIVFGGNYGFSTYDHNGSSSICETNTGQLTLRFL